MHFRRDLSFPWPSPCRAGFNGSYLRWEIYIEWKKNKKSFFGMPEIAFLRRALPLLQRGKGGKKKTLEVVLQESERGKGCSRAVFFLDID